MRYENVSQIEFVGEDYTEWKEKYRIKNKLDNKDGQLTVIIEGNSFIIEMLPTNKEVLKSIFVYALTDIADITIVLERGE